MELGYEWNLPDMVEAINESFVEPASYSRDGLIRVEVECLRSLAARSLSGTARPGVIEMFANQHIETIIWAQSQPETFPSAAYFAFNDRRWY